MGPSSFQSSFFVTIVHRAVGIHQVGARKRKATLGLISARPIEGHPMISRMAGTQQVQSA